VFSGFSAGGGNEVHIQHDYQLISIYKHNSALLKKTGEVVQAGESIAIVGNSGEHSDGTHLHFEMWQKGVPLDVPNSSQVNEATALPAIMAFFIFVKLKSSVLAK